MPFFAKNRPRMIASGGTITAVGIEKVHTFTTSGTFTCLGRGYIQVLVVGGGDNGGDGSASYTNKGGDGGEVIYNSRFFINPADISVTVGGVSQNSIFSTITAIGGGGVNGGAALTAAQNQNYPNCSTTTPGVNGTTSSITGVAYVYASSGSAGCFMMGGAYGNYDSSLTPPGTGAGAGGGAWASAGGDSGLTPAATAATNYGAGGGGGSKGWSYGAGAAGKSGVVIIRFLPI